MMVADFTEVASLKSGGLGRLDGYTGSEHLSP